MKFLDAEYGNRVEVDFVPRGTVGHVIDRWLVRRFYPGRLVLLDRIGRRVSREETWADVEWGDPVGFIVDFDKERIGEAYRIVQERMQERYAYRFRGFAHGFTDAMAEGDEPKEWGILLIVPDVAKFKGEMPRWEETHLGTLRVDVTKDHEWA